MFLENSSIEKLIFIVDKPNVMINVITCPNNKIRIFRIDDVFKSSKSSSHRNITSAIITPITRTCITFYHPFFLSTTRWLCTFTISSFKIASINMRVRNLKHSDWIWMFLRRVFSVWWRCVFDNSLLIILLKRSFKVYIITKSNL